MERVMIFIDYWNFVNNLNDLHKRQTSSNFKIDWDSKLRDFILEETKKVIGSDLSYAGMFVCGSYDPTQDTATGKIKDSTYIWVTQTLPKFKGVTVRFKPRQLQKKRTLFCNKCNFLVDKCPNCNEVFSGFTEKGVDTEIVIEMFALAKVSYDIAVLVSDDRDFVAAVQALRQKGIKVIHGRPSSNNGNDLDNECFASIEIGNNRSNFERSK
jgi:uncharacterized LabA/DUF88 family protein